jgi:hypothetical protein
MPTLNIKRETMDKVEDIQETFEVEPSKREVARRAFSEYLEKRKNGEQS